MKPVAASVRCFLVPPTLALYSLTETSDEPFQKRLANAYIYHLIHVHQSNVPKDVWADLQELTAAVTSKKAVGNEGSVAASTSVMSDEEATKWLRKIAEMFNDIARAYGVETGE